MSRCLLLIILSAIGLASAFAGLQVYPQDLLPVEALEKLEESARSDCSICARQLQKEAFEMLSFALDPGRVIQTTSACLLTRDPSGASDQLQFSCHGGENSGLKKISDTFPQIVFRFHTVQNHLVGIDKDDFTPQQFAALYQNAPPGSLFSGALKIISFSYGDGPSFLYLASEHQLQIHCRIIDLSIEKR